jgi:hypothetical protein
MRLESVGRLSQRLTACPMDSRFPIPPWSGPHNLADGAAAEVGAQDRAIEAREGSIRRVSNCEVHDVAGGPPVQVTCGTMAASRSRAYLSAAESASERGTTRCLTSRIPEPTLPGGRCTKAARRKEGNRLRAPTVPDPSARRPSANWRPAPGCLAGLTQDASRLLFSSA